MGYKAVNLNNLMKTIESLNAKFEGDVVFDLKKEEDEYVLSYNVTKDIDWLDRKILYPIYKLLKEDFGEEYFGVRVSYDLDGLFPKRKVRNWADLYSVNTTSKTHKLVVDLEVGCARLIPFDRKKYRTIYLTTHSFYPEGYMSANMKLKRAGFDIEIVPWREI